MIDKLKKILWKVDGMEFTDNPAGSKGAFQLKYGKQVIGVLSYENNRWTFKYSDEFRKNQKERHQGEQDSLAASFACKAAIKAGDKLTEKEMRLLVDQLFATSIPYACPHGRPIVIKISLDEFDKRFGRS